MPIDYDNISKVLRKYGEDELKEKKMKVIKTDVLSLEHYIKRLQRENEDRAVLLLDDKMKSFIDKNPSRYYDIARMAEHRNVLEKEWVIVEKILTDLREVNNGQNARLDNLFHGEKA